MRYRRNTELRPGPAVALAMVLCLLAAALALHGCSTSNPAGPSQSETFLVDTAGGGDFLTIQSALNAASDGDTVLVAPGVYTGPGNKNLNFGGSSVVLAGTGQRDEVVIDCEGSGRGFYIDGNESPVIENLMVTGGDTIKGGGIYLEGSSPVLRNVRFVENSASDGGGGLYCRNGSPALQDVLFDLNTAWVHGGGMLCVSSSPALSRTIFYHNRSEGSGGGMACLFSSPALSECVFSESWSVYGGALYCGASTPSVTACTFVNNTGSEGSVMAADNDSSPSVTHTIMAHNGPDEVYLCDRAAPFTTLSCIFDNGEFNDLCGTYTTSMLYLDPLFCDLEAGDLTLRSASVCLPGNNQWGIQIGAFGEGCE